MKKFLIACAFIAALNSCIAQVKISAKAGWNYSTARAYFADVKQPTHYTSGFAIGAMAKVPFDGILFFTPSVMINKKGFIIKPLLGNITQQQYSLGYLDLIPALSIYLPQGHNSFSLSLGPDFGFTKIGKVKTTDKNNVTTSQNITFGFGDIGNYDIGLNASVGYHFTKMFVELGYVYGLVNINNNEEVDQHNIRNRMLNFSVGYYFK